MSEKRVIDYAWQHPAPHNIVAGGYLGVARYLSLDRAKDITTTEVKALHDQGLGILLVWETTAGRALAGKAAGVADAHAASARAALLGYPGGTPLFYAVDFDAKPAQVAAYFDGIESVPSHYPPGDYGGRAIVDAAFTDWHWQSAGWSQGILSKNAHLFQRATPVGRIPGSPSGWDENVICRDIPMWHRAVVPAPKPKPPVPTPAPKPKKPTRLEVFWQKYQQDNVIDVALLEKAASKRPGVKATLAVLLRLVDRFPKK